MNTPTERRMTSVLSAFSMLLVFSGMAVKCGEALEVTNFCSENFTALTTHLDLPKGISWVSTSASDSVAANTSCSLHVSAPPGSVVWMTVDFFDMKGPEDCFPGFDSFYVIIASPKTEYKWCGQRYAPTLLLPGTFSILYEGGDSENERGVFKISFKTVSSFPALASATSSLYLHANPNQLRMLYSSRFTMPHSPENRSLSWNIYTNPGYDIFLRVIEFKLRSVEYLQIDEQRYFSRDAIPVYLHIKNTSVSIRNVYFVEKDIGHFDFNVVVLEFVAVRRDDTLCQSLNSVIEKEVTQDYVLHCVKPTPGRECHVTLSTNDAENVLDTRWLSDLNPDEVSLTDSERLDIDQDFAGHKKYRAFTNVRTKRGSLTLSFRNSASTAICFVVRAVDKRFLSTVVLGVHNYLWIPTMGNVSQTVKSAHEFRLLFLHGSDVPWNYNFHVKARTSNMTTELQPAQYVSVFNGPSTSYFELTRDCYGDRRIERNIYGGLSQVVTIKLAQHWESTTADGFWLIVNLESGTGVNKSYPLTEIKNNSISVFKSSLSSTLNLYCVFRTPTPPEGSVIRFRRPHDSFINNYYSLFEWLEKGQLSKMYIKKTFNYHLFLYSNHSLLITLSYPYYYYTTAPFIFSFEMLVAQESGIETSCSQQRLRAIDKQQTSTTPNYPNYIMNKQECSWQIYNDNPSFLIVISTPNITYNVDDYSLAVNEKWVYSKEPFMRIYRESEVEVIMTPWRVMPGTYFFYSTQVAPLEPSCNRTIYLQRGPIQYLSYKFDAPHYEIFSCWWEIKAPSEDFLVKLQIESVSLNFDNSTYCYRHTYILVEEKGSDSKLWPRICGLDSDPTLIISKSDTLFVTFMQQTYHAFSTTRSFNLSLTPLFNTGCYGVAKNLKAVEYPQPLHSPHYPSRFQENMKCYWVIEAMDDNHVVKLEILDAFMGASCDNWISLLDGSDRTANQLAKLCTVDGKTTYYSTGPSMFVTFETGDRNQDNFGPFRGFKLQYSSQSPPGDSTESETTRVVTITCAIAAILLFAMCTGFYCRRRQLSKRRSQQQATRPPTTRAEPAVQLRSSEAAVYVVSPVIVNTTSSTPPPAYPSSPPPYPVGPFQYTGSSGQQQLSPSVGYLSPPSYEEATSPAASGNSQTSRARGDLQLSVAPSNNNINNNDSNNSSNSNSSNSSSNSSNSNNNSSNNNNNNNSSSNNNNSSSSSMPPIAEVREETSEDITTSANNDEVSAHHTDTDSASCEETNGAGNTVVTKL